MEKRKLFMVGDSAVATGFAQVTHNLIHQLKDRWEIDVLGINYRGDPHEILKEARHWSPQAIDLQDFYGQARIVPLTQKIQPDIVLIMLDPWILAEYVPLFDKMPGKKVGYTPVDAHNIKKMFSPRLNVYDHIITYTEFARTELTYSGVTIPMTPIICGVDTTVFYPLNKQHVRETVGLDPSWYIVQATDRNAPRKRLDLALYYFAEWVRTRNIPDNVHFYYHGMLKDAGWDLADLAKTIDDHYLRTYGKTPGIHARFMYTDIKSDTYSGIPLDKMNYMYNIADVKLSTTVGEGFGLTTAESMACGIPNIVPRYSALGEWANGGVEYTHISDIPYFTPSGLNTWAGVPDMHSTIEALDKLYRDKEYRDTLGKKGYDLITQDKFKWSNIADQFHAIFEGLLNESTIE